MKRIFIIFLIFLFGCASTNKKIVKPQLNIKKNEEIKDLNSKMATLEKRVDNLETEIQNIKKTLKENSEESKMDKYTKTLILSKISELYAKDEQYLVTLSKINRELNEIKKRLSTKKKITKVKIKKHKIQKYRIAYDICLTLYKKKIYNKAIKCFNSFIKDFKNSRLISNAYFWKGECYFKKGNFTSAINNYDVILTKYPKSPKVPSALLKEGLAFYNIKDYEGAKIFLEKVINEFPTTPQAFYAKKFIKKFQLK